MKVAGKAKQIDLMRNTDCRERSNLFHVINIGCIFNQIEKKNLHHRRSSTVLLKKKPEASLTYTETKL